MTVDTTPLGVDGFLAYRVTYTSEPSVLDSVYEGICYDSVSPMPEEPHPSTDYENDYWCFIRTDALEEVRQNGWDAKIDDDYAWTPSEHPWQLAQDLEEAKKEGWTLVRVYDYNHRVFDANNEPLPVGKFVDYIGWQMHNESYNLDKVVEHLSKQESVHDISRQRIPGYNAEPPYRTEYVSFRWTPTVKEYRMAVEWIDENNGYSDLGQAVFALDLLGLRKCGAAKHDTFYAPREY